MKTYFWEGFCHLERHAGISTMQKAIQKEGDIVNTHWFSDISIAFEIEIRESQLTALYAALQSVILLKAVDASQISFDNECTLFVNVTFSQATGNLTQEIPAVPG